MKRLSLLLIILLSVQSSFAQVKPKDIDALVEKAQKQWNVPGLSVAVVKAGKIFLSKGYGVMEEGK